MEKMEFPWLREIKEPHQQQDEVPLRKDRLRKIRPYFSHIGVITLIGGLALVGRCSSSDATKVEPRRTAAPEIIMMSLVAIPKGHLIPVAALTEVAIRAGTLSKTQKLRALVPDQIPKLRHEIIAKRDIAPQTPIFWTDLMLKPLATSQRSNPSTRIYFDQTGATP